LSWGEHFRGKKIIRKGGKKNGKGKKTPAPLRALGKAEKGAQHQGEERGARQERREEVSPGGKQGQREKNTGGGGGETGLARETLSKNNQQKGRGGIGKRAGKEKIAEGNPSSSGKTRSTKGEEVLTRGNEQTKKKEETVVKKGKKQWPS